MGARNNKIKGRGKGQSVARESCSVEEEGVEKETREKHKGLKYNVDFQELNEDFSNLDLGDDQAKDVEKPLDACDQGLEEAEVKECLESQASKDLNLNMVDGNEEKTVEVSERSKTDRSEKIDIGRITNDEGFKILEAVELGESATSPVNARGELPENGVHRPVQAMTPNVLTAVMPTPPRQEVAHGERDNLVVRGSTTLPSNRMVINRYPGYLFIQIDQVERFMATRNDIETVSIKVESKVFSYETKKYNPWTNININEILRVPIDRVENLGFPMRFILLLHHRPSGVFSKRETTKACEITLTIDTNRIHSIHNNLLENVSRWDHYTSRNFFKNLKNFFTNGTTDAWSLRTYLSFISNDELQLIPTPLPYDLKSLSKWLIVKKFSYNMWFKGFVNLRGDLSNVCTNLWKRRYVKCYGYIIFVFNEHSRSLVGTINLVDASFDPDIQNKVYFENFLSVSVGSNVVELHFDTKEKYKTCKNALVAMLPRALFYKRK